ncbi:MAG: GIY-YIG nuclease family protein [Candidatus Sungiibacteriota bacterium]|uniref:GIY-YIG nuclease family protein n=1 Tax=Candidatus Sungiibacteriota bacterium TaxID=2750080 RepID=A0A7T5RJH1_9BACT|nr:MAG: GIY-YIG nuclease family protein [Candidatus Sungbacteria bacterium]
MTKQAPSSAGVYMFKSGSDRPLYIGKAVNLKKRLASYFRKNIGGKARYLRGGTIGIEWIETPNEFAALIKEAELIKKYRPKYNILLRDDKNYFYVGATKEKFPRLFTTHQPAQNTHFIGPFTSGVALKTALKFLRRIFPYCTCKKPHKRRCLTSQIGRCLGYCCVKAQTPAERKIKEYGGNIKNIMAILQGKKKHVILLLKKEMRAAVKKQEFERAATLRDQVSGLENIFGHAQLLEVRLPVGSRTSVGSWRKIEKNLRTILATKKKISRIEGYDISNIFGSAATGSMVVFSNGMPVKSKYRKFKIKTIHQSNDIAMLQEVLRRRFQHKEWSFPDLILIDGGKPQLNAALAILRKSYFSREVRLSKVVSLAKREEDLFIPGRKHPIRLRILPQETSYFFQRIRDEAHRFAKQYHQKRRELLFRQ